MAGTQIWCGSVLLKILNAVSNLVDIFQETVSMYDAKRYGRSANLPEEKLLDISDSLQQCPRKSLQRSV